MTDERDDDADEMVRGVCGLPGSLVNVRNGQGMTPLHLAVSRGCAPDVVRHLLSLGADPTTTAKYLLRLHTR